MPSQSKRDLIAEIKAYGGRVDSADESGFPDSDWERLNQIIETYLEIDSLGAVSRLRPELERHVIVSLAAVVQAAVRRTITEIVDQKELRGDELPELRDVKLTLAMARELKNHSFSFGELVAHFLSVSGVDSISASLDHICGEDLTNLMRPQFVDRESPDGNTVTVEEQLTKFRKSLIKLFEYRNIFAHEIGLKVSVQATELYGFVTVTMALVSALSHFRAKLSS